MFLAETHSQELRVPVTRARVEIRTDLDKVTATLFLPPEGAIEDLFEESAPFFPAESGGRIRFFARASIVSIAVGAADLPKPSSSDADDGIIVPFRLRAVTVHLCNAVSLAGMLDCESGRTLDFLNQRPKSFRLHVEDKVHVIAKAHVEYIEEAQ